MPSSFPTATPASYQRLRRPEIGTRADPEREARATVSWSRSALHRPLGGSMSIQSAGRHLW